MCNQYQSSQRSQGYFPKSLNHYLYYIFTVWVAAQNDLQEGSGILPQHLADQEGSGQFELLQETESSFDSTFGQYLDSQFEPSIEEALLSSDSWVVADNLDNDIINNVIINTDNDIIFVEEPRDGRVGNPEQNQDILTGDDEDYVAEISGNNALEEQEEETNALAGLELDQTNFRTLETEANGNEIELITVNPIDHSVHVEGNALGKTGDGETVENPVLNKYGGLSAILLLAAAVGIGALLSFIGFIMCKAKMCKKGLDVP